MGEGLRWESEAVLKGQACVLSKAVMRSLVLGKNRDGEGVFSKPCLL